MRVRRWPEILLYVGSLTGVAFASYALFFQSSKVERAEAPSAESLGIVRPLGADVRLKPQGQLNWQTLGANENTFDQDTIFTGQNSRAKLDFTSGTEILVDPKSLLIVSREGKREKILTLDYGGFSGKILKGERLVLQTKEKKIEISGLQDSSVRIEKTEDQKLVVSALEGNLQVQSDLKIEEVQANENLKLDVKTNEIVREKLQISLLYPRPSKILWLSKDSPVHFEWQGALSQKAKVVIASDASFTGIVKEVSSEASSADVLLASNQSYYWRVESGEDSSPVSEFTVAPLEKPQVISPVQKSQFSAQKDKASVELKWKDQTLSESYELQIGRDPALSQVEKRIVTKLGSTQVDLPPGNYFAKIRSQHPERVVALESDVVEFSVVAQKTEVPLVLTEHKEPEKAEEPPLEPAAFEKPIEVPPFAQASAIKKIKREPAEEKKPEVIATPIETSPPVVVEPPKAEEEPRPPAKPEPLVFSVTWPKFWMYLGIGANYTRIEEKSSEVKSNYPGLSAPSFAFEGGTALTDMTNIAVQYKTTPANGDNKAEKSSNLSYVWKTAGVEASTRLNKANEGSQWSLLYGVQYHAVPIVIFEPLTLLPSVREAQYLNAVMGAKYQYFVSQRQFFVISGHYQHPLSSTSAGNSGFQMKSPFIFDGSIGSEYRMTEALWGGIYWYGQYHSFKYDYTDQGTLHQNTQNMIYSNIELRLSFRF